MKYIITIILLAMLMGCQATDGKSISYPPSHDVKGYGGGGG